jgi:GH25 family lysozyme M1 (1,4-beta-N-acetylmuramidase)
LQVRNFANAAGLQSGSVTMIDWESEDASKLPNVTLVAQMIDSLKLLTGRLPLVYHGMYLVTSPKINSCPWFVPKYGPEPRSRNWLFWQDTPTKEIPGVGNADHDFFNGTEVELEAWFKNGALPKRVLSP